MEEAGIEFEYEKYSITLVPAFSLPNKCVEKAGKKFKPCNPKIRAITYKPDFVGNGWVMETKGLRRPRFDLVWKLFKKHLVDNGLDWVVMMPSNQEQIDICVEFIKQYNRGVLQIPEDFQLVTRGRVKPKVPKDEDGQSAAGGLSSTKNRKRGRLSTDVAVPVKGRLRRGQRK